VIVALASLENSIEPTEPTESTEPIETRCRTRVTVGGVDAHSVINDAAARRLILSKVRERRGDVISD